MRAVRGAARAALAGFMVVAGAAHFVSHESFLAQTPTFLPARSMIIWVTGVMEVALGIALVALPGHRRRVGWLLAGFLLAVFPGNIYQAVAGTPAFGLDTPAARWLRLPFQPALIALALWSSGAWPRQRPPGGR